MDNNQKAILYHMGRGAALNITQSDTVAFVLYPDERYVAVNADSALALVEEGLVRECGRGEFALVQVAQASA